MVVVVQGFSPGRGRLHPGLNAEVQGRQCTTARLPGQADLRAGTSACYQVPEERVNFGSLVARLSPGLTTTTKLRAARRRGS